MCYLPDECISYVLERTGGGSSTYKGSLERVAVETVDLAQIQEYLETWVYY